MQPFLIAAAALVVVVTLAWLGLPALLSALGLHKMRVLAKRDLTGKRALIITTSCGALGDTGKKTGVFASEMTAPYYTFRDAGVLVDIASVRGGAIPIEPASLKWPVKSHADRRYEKDVEFRAQTKSSKRLADLDPAAYDFVFLAGGWGAAYDLAQSPEVGAFVTRVYAGDKIVGGVCHGPLGFLGARDPSGAPLVAGRRITAVTDKQIRELGILFTPKHPERDLRAAGAVFESAHRFRDIFASHVVTDGRIVTGQNQNDGAETADRMMQLADVKR